MDNLVDLGVNLLAALIGFVFARLVSRVRYLKRTRLTRQLWGSFRSGAPVTIVLPVFDNVDMLKIEASGLVGTGDIRGILDLQETLLDVGVVSEIVEDKKLHHLKTTQDMIIIGGPDSNIWTKAALDALGAKVGVVQEDLSPFVFDAGPTRDDRDGEAVKYCAERGEGNAVSTDFGIVVVGKNGLVHRGHVMVLAGVWGHGSEAAVRLVTSSIKNLYEQDIGLSEPFELIFSVRVVNGNSLEPNIQMARNL